MSHRQRLIALFVIPVVFFGHSVFGQSDLFTKIRELQSQNKDADALTRAEESLSRVTDKEERRLFMMAKALAAYNLGKLDISLATFEELLKEKNNLTEYAHYYSGLIYVKNNQLVEAANHFHKILNLSPNLKLQSLAQRELANIELEKKNFRQARAILVTEEKKSRREEFYPEVIYQLARAERGLNNVGPFCRWMKKLYTHYPEFSKISDWGGNLAENKFYDKPTQCAQTPEDRRLRIKNLQWAGQNEKAHREISDLRSRMPASEKFALDKLEVHYLLHEGEVQKALDLLKPYYETHKNDFQYLVTLANAAARVGDIQAAVGSYYAAYKLSPRSKLGKQALYNSAFLSYQFQDYDGAARRFQEFMKVYSGSGLSRDAKWHLAWIRYLRADYEGAYKALSELRGPAKRGRKVVKSYPQDRVNYWQAMALFRMGKYDQAKPIFEQIAKDKLLGYYAMAAQQRLKKIEELMPKVPRRALSDQSMKITRFSTSEILMPVDDPKLLKDMAASEENESEETITISDLTQGTGEDADVQKEMVQEELSSDETGSVTVVQEEEVEKVTSFSNPVLVKRFERARELMILGLNDWAKWDLYDIERKTSNREYLKTLMSEYEKVEYFHRSSYIGQVYFGSQRAYHGVDGVRYLWEHTYPKAYAQFVTKYSKQFDIPSELIWGIMRAESQYKRDVVSPVGALGLMQVMPGTGAKVSEMLNEKEFEPKKLLEPEMGIKIGSRYLQRLMKKFENNIALVAAGYNAGPHRVKGWLSSFGQLDLDEFVEHIPFLETRNYVKKVVSNFQVYSHLYNGKKEGYISLAESLKIRLIEPPPYKETWEDI
ncbi:MAG: hypothetical protein BroJett040_07410 [Oligoflexia bacterium]|nr:MAG: hypothetical protein BroJett040_07410 [Oligoflexia bacterium]